MRNRPLSPLPVRLLLPPGLNPLIIHSFLRFPLTPIPTPTLNLTSQWPNDLMALHVSDNRHQKFLQSHQRSCTVGNGPVSTISITRRFRTILATSFRLCWMVACFGHVIKGHGWLNFSSAMLLSFSQPFRATTEVSLFCRSSWYLDRFTHVILYL